MQFRSRYNYLCLVLFICLNEDFTSLTLQSDSKLLNSSNQNFTVCIAIRLTLLHFSFLILHSFH